MALFVVCFLLDVLTSRCPNLFLARFESLPHAILEVRLEGRV